MDDVRREDRRLFWQEARRPLRLFYLLAAVLYAIYLGGVLSPRDALAQLVFDAVIIGVICAVHVAVAQTAAVRRRFRSRRMEALWAGCEDRLRRFDEVLARSRRHDVAALSEMPKTIRQVADGLYLALRRADIVSDEVHASERGLVGAPPVWEGHPETDPQSNELYRVADRNIAEYRAQYAAVLAGVQRTEAQAAVFMTTVDSLRMKILGYRLVGRSPEMSSYDLLEALAEARAQLQSIDVALDELDLGAYPKTIAVVPPPPPDAGRLNQS